MWAGLSGPGMRSVWLSWQVSDRVRHSTGALVADVVRRPRVTTSARAKAAFGLPGAPGTVARGLLGLRSGVFFVAYAVTATGVAAIYVRLVQAAAAGQ